MHINTSTSNIKASIYCFKTIAIVSTSVLFS